jgi:hypothetical protein
MSLQAEPMELRGFVLRKQSKASHRTAILSQLCLNTF